MNYKGSRKAKAHITIGLCAHGIATVTFPHLSAELVFISVVINLVWVWEG